MKRILTILTISLVAMGLHAGTLEFTYYFGEPSVNLQGDYQTLIFEDTYLTGNAGENSIRKTGKLLPA